VESPLNGYAAQIWADQREYKAVLQKKYEEAQRLMASSAAHGSAAGAKS
jgi:hypothetical protein